MLLQGVGVGPKFEQVPSDHHQMSLAGVGPQVWCLGGYLPCDLCG